MPAFKPIPSEHPLSGWIAAMSGLAAFFTAITIHRLPTLALLAIAIVAFTHWVPDKRSLSFKQMDRLKVREAKQVMRDLRRENDNRLALARVVSRSNRSS